MTFCVGSSSLLWNGRDTLVHFGEGLKITISAFGRDGISVSHLTGFHILLGYRTN